ncbi:MAG: InlB B-repeat-containing protein [Pontimonas sp.]
MLASLGAILVFSIGLPAYAAHVSRVAELETGSTPVAVAVSPLGDQVYVVNNLDDSVSIFSSDAIQAAIDSDPLSCGGAPGAAIPCVLDLELDVEDAPVAVAFVPNGTYAYVANSGSNSVSVIDVAEQKVAAKVTVGDLPSDLAITPDGNYVFVPNKTSGTISVIATADVVAVANPASPGELSASTTVTGFAAADRVAISPSGESIVIGRFAARSASAISISDVEAVLGTSAAVSSLGTIDFDGNTLSGAVFSPDGAHLFTLAQYDEDTDIVAFSFQESPFLVTELDRLDLSTGTQYMGLATSPDAEYLYVSTNFDKLTTIDIADPSNLSVHSTSAGDGIREPAVAPNGKYVYAPTGAAEGRVRVLSTGINVVSFDANGGVGAMSTQGNDSAAALRVNSMTRAGYTFSGWNSAADGTGTSYADSATYDFSADLTLYAQWTAIPAAPSSAAGSAASATPAPDPVPAPRVARALPAPLPVAVSAPAVVTRAPGATADKRAVAMVGGRQVAVTAQNLGERSARFGVGKVSVDIGVSESGGRVEGTGGIPSLKIARNQAATLKGGGLQPRSVLQVFLPATDGSFIELPSVDVGVDGSFVGELTIGTSAREMPLPIGQRSIQMVGIDEDGNETVLDIPITVAQPLPSPAVNRLSGERPALEPGQLLVLTAGTPEIVEVDLVDNGVNVSGDGWNIAVAGAPTETTTESLALKRDEPVAFSGAGFMPGTRADVWLFSDPTLLGTVDIADDGTFTADFAVDSNFVPTGDHTLQVQGVGTDGYVRAASLGVMVADAGIGSSGTSEADGFIWLPITLIGASLGGLLILVAVGVAVRRRTRV